MGSQRTLVRKKVYCTKTEDWSEGIDVDRLRPFLSHLHIDFVVVTRLVEFFYNHWNSFARNKVVNRLWNNAFRII